MDRRGDLLPNLLIDVIVKRRGVRYGRIQRSI